MLWLIAGVAVVLAACGGDGESDLPTPEEIARIDETIPMEALPDPLPEAVIVRDEGSLQVEEARDEIIYTVLPGDSLAGIAARFGVDATELQRINGIVDPSVLRAGDELRVPVREGTEAERIAASLDDEEATSLGPPPGEEYIVQPGDTLFDIGLSFGISYLDIQAYNRLTDFQAGNLAVGLVLIIPPPEEEETGTGEPPG